MLDSTREKRLQRFILKKLKCEQNNYGRRLIWIREKLKLTPANITKNTNIPRSTLSDWECGCRTTSYEDMLVLSLFFSSLWEEKFIHGFPEWNGYLVIKPSINFILFGKDPSLTEAIELSQMNQELEKKMTIEIMTRKQIEDEFKSQIDIFDMAEI